MPGIFISYRRQDALAEARGVYERLRGEFGHPNVFIDLEGLDYGVDFVEQLNAQLANCQVLLALIGPHWLDLPDGRGSRRIDDDNDFVRIELRTALARGVRVVPVLINGARMPRTVDLPADLHALLRRQALELDFKRFDGDMGRLVASLKRVTAAAAPPVPVAEPPPPATSATAPATTLAAAPAQPREAAPPAPAPRKSRPRPPPVDDMAQHAAPAAVSTLGAPQPAPWWQSAISKLTSGAAVVVFLAYQAWQNGWWQPNKPASPAVVVAPVASSPSAAPPPTGLASVALGRPISLQVAVEPVRSGVPVSQPAPAAPAKPMAPFSRFRDCESDACPWMIALPAGSFMMGSPATEPERFDREGPQHRVQVKAFAVGQFEVTFAQWDACVAAAACTHNPADNGWGRGQRPVINVSWNDAQHYVKWLSSRTGHAYRLLSEAEWEYAARAGTTTPFAFGERISTDQANFDGNITYNGSAKGVYCQKTLPVGSLAANAWQLHDLHGNVWEWVQDCWHGNYSGAPVDGSSWTSGCAADRRVLRGGGWIDIPRDSRSAIRSYVAPDFRFSSTGFRLARTLLGP